jgi:hypothetical protein
MKQSIKSIENEIRWLKKDFKEDNSDDDLTYLQACKMELEDLSPLATYDIGYIQGLKSALTYITK